MSLTARIPGSSAEHRVGWAAAWPLACLITAGIAIELLLLAGWLRPLSLWRTPTNLPAGAPMVLIFGQTRDGALRFLVPAVFLLALWGAALALSARVRGRAAALSALGLGALFLLTLLPINPAGTQDIYHNVADGRLFWLHGVNPTLVPPIAFPEDVFARHVWGYADLPSAYGPLWYYLTGIPTMLAGDGLIPNLVTQKALVSAFLFGTAVVTTLAANRIAPDRITFAAVLGGWCPLLLWESAGNGHNDAVMALFFAGALLAAARRAYLWVLPLLALAMLIKFTVALAAPVALVWLLRRPDVSRRDVAAGVALSVALTVAMFAPMAAGGETVAAVRRPGMTFILSPATLAHGALTGVIADADASLLVRAATGLCFAALYGVVLLRSRGDVRDLAASCFDVLFLYLVLVSWWFWPWYLTWLAPAAALAPGRARPAAFAVFACGGLLTYLYWWPDPVWRTREWFVAYALIVTLGFGMPLLIWAAGNIDAAAGRLGTRRNGKPVKRPAPSPSRG